MMKYILSGVGVLLVGAGITFGVQYYQKNNIDYQSEQFATTVIPKLTAKWSPDTLINYADDELLRGTTPETIARLNEVFRTKLGAYRDINQCTGRAVVVQSRGNNVKTTANYHCSTVFEKGTGTITIGLLQSNKKAWRISNFSVDSPLLRR